MMVNSRFGHLSFFVAFLAFALGGDCQEVDSASAEPPDFQREWEVWHQLDMSDGRKVTDARFIMQGYIMGERQKATLDVKITDAKVLNLLNRSFGDVSIRAPPKSRGVLGVAPIGRLYCTISADKVIIDIYPHSFMLASIPMELNDAGPFWFHSPTLAIVLDAILKSHGHAAFSEKQREGLTGEHSIKANIKYGQKLIAETEALKPKE